MNYKELYEELLKENEELKCKIQRDKEVYERLQQNQLVSMTEISQKLHQYQRKYENIKNLLVGLVSIIED